MNLFKKIMGAITYPSSNGRYCTIFLDREKPNSLLKFKDYNDLPFSKSIQNKLFESHLHGDQADLDEIVYREVDVLILLQMLKDESKI